MDILGSLRTTSSNQFDIDANKPDGCSDFVTIRKSDKLKTYSINKSGFVLN